ncbi:hybrid sensor histidine kinase/response regulator [Bradyrhizobium sp. SZCCHNR2028]|uniref:hybrid sensor histidine kinase/response regulator n=1 Tax=Bradyrhizobium sp. SZCCHNR2028 TaxID=3057382 RepID=UPI0028E9AF43|nr:hybrid sensor histidine kinase/response regulator [Bradyrhizobium sp. SZCCHNR2028]
MLEHKPQRDRAVVDSGDASDLSSERHDIFFAAVETTRMPMIVTDPRQNDNPILFANRAFLEMTGYEISEIVGANCRFLQGPDTDRDTIAAIRTAIANRQDIAVEILNYRKNGAAFWNALFVSPVYNRDGELVYYFGSQLDVSRRRDAESALVQSQKMEAIGQLTGGIAHDFNNILQVIIGYTETLQGAVADLAPRHRRAVENIRTAANRAATLTQQLLSFSRKQRLDSRPINLNNMIETMVQMARHTLGDSVRIVVKAQPGLWNSRVDQTQAEVALLNLFVNARDAMPHGGTLTIRTENKEIAEEDIVQFGVPKGGRYVALKVSDDGVGIPHHILARVAEPFFTTKEEGKGTGLGLAMVYGFTRQSGGSTYIYSEVGLGTTVQLLFPATEQAIAAPSIRPQMAMERSGSERILIVEDRPDVAELARSILEDFGYRIEVAANAHAALELLDSEVRFDLLFTDLVMPGGMNGTVLAREARKSQPKLKVLLTTGYSDAAVERADANIGEFEIINKPYRRTDLVRRVRQLLDGPTGVT